MKRKFILLTMLIIVIFMSACGGKTDNVDTPAVIDPNPDLLTQMDDLASQNVDLEEFKASCQATVGSQDEVITALIDDVDSCVAEYSFLEETYNDLLTADPEPTEEPVAEVTEEPVDPDAWKYTCGYVTVESRVFQKSYDKQGDLRVNKAGNWILKGVPTKEVAGFYVGDTICFFFAPFQVDRMRVVTITGRAYGYYFPIKLIDFVKPVNPNE